MKYLLALAFLLVSCGDDKQNEDFRVVNQSSGQALKQIACMSTDEDICVEINVDGVVDGEFNSDSCSAIGDDLYSVGSYCSETGLEAEPCEINTSILDSNTGESVYLTQTYYFYNNRMNSELACELMKEMLEGQQF